MYTHNKTWLIWLNDSKPYHWFIKHLVVIRVNDWCSISDEEQELQMLSFLVDRPFHFQNLVPHNLSNLIFPHFFFPTCLLSSSTSLFFSYFHWRCAFLNMRTYLPVHVCLVSCTRLRRGQKTDIDAYIYTSMRVYQNQQFVAGLSKQAQFTLVGKWDHTHWQSASWSRTTESELVSVWL